MEQSQNQRVRITTYFYQNYQQNQFAIILRIKVKLRISKRILMIQMKMQGKQSLHRQQQSTQHRKTVSPSIKNGWIGQQSQRYAGWQKGQNSNAIKSNQSSIQQKQHMMLMMQEQIQFTKKAFEQKFQEIIKGNSIEINNLHKLIKQNEMALNAKNQQIAELKKCISASEISNPHQAKSHNFSSKSQDFDHFQTKINDQQIKMSFLTKQLIDLQGKMKQNTNLMEKIEKGSIKILGTKLVNLKNHLNHFMQNQALRLNLIIQKLNSEVLLKQASAIGKPKILPSQGLNQNQTEFFKKTVQNFQFLKEEVKKFMGKQFHYENFNIKPLENQLTKLKNQVKHLQKSKNSFIVQIQDKIRGKVKQMIENSKGSSKKYQQFDSKSPLEVSVRSQYAVKQNLDLKKRISVADYNMNSNQKRKKSVSPLHKQTSQNNFRISQFQDYKVSVVNDISDNQIQQDRFFYSEYQQRGHKNAQKLKFQEKFVQSGSQNEYDCRLERTQKIERKKQIGANCHMKKQIKAYGKNEQLKNYTKNQLRLIQTMRQYCVHLPLLIQVDNTGCIKLQNSQQYLIDKQSNYFALSKKQLKKLVEQGYLQF